MEQVRSRVAHLRDDEALAFEHGTGAGGAHALAAASFVRRLQDRVVRGLDGAPELVRVGMLRRPLGDDVDGDFGCNLACGVAAHAVCHYEQRRRHDERVLVVVAHAADVGSTAKRCRRSQAPAPVRAMPLRGTLPARCAMRVMVEGLFVLNWHYANLTRMATSPMFTTSLFFRATGPAMSLPLTAVPLVEPRSSMNRFCPMGLKHA